MPRYNHMSWCVGVHESGECVLVRGNNDYRSDEPGVLLSAAPCNDSLLLRVREASITSMEQADQLAGWVRELAVHLPTSEVEVDCERHYHNFDANGNDHIEGCPATWEECPGCGDEFDCDVCNNTVDLNCEGACLP